MLKSITFADNSVSLSYISARDNIIAPDGIPQSINKLDLNVSSKNGRNLTTRKTHSGKIISFIATARYVSGRIKSFLNGTDASLNPKTNIHIGVVVSAKIDITFDI